MNGVSKICVLLNNWLFEEGSPKFAYQFVLMVMYRVKPVEGKKGTKRKSSELTVPGHYSLGSGTDLKRFLVPRSKLDLGAEIHDFKYANRSITTEEADEQFYEDTKDTGLLEAVSREFIRLKHATGLDKYFRPEESDVHYIGADSSDHYQQAMAESVNS